MNCKYVEAQSFEGNKIKIVTYECVREWGAST